MFFTLCIQNHIIIEPRWVPRENEIADYISRIVDYDDWQLNPLVFAMLDRKWGPHTVDRFAASYNRQVYRYNSRFVEAESEAIDAFTVNWVEENNWWCPPVYMITRVLRHAEICQASGTLVVPLWQSAPFWPIVCPQENSFASFVVAVCDLPVSSELFLPGATGSVLFNGHMPNTRVLALRLDFTGCNDCMGHM